MVEDHPYEGGTSDGKSFLAEKHPVLETKAALRSARTHLDRPSLRALPRTLAPRFALRSWSRSVCMGTSSTELCQVQPEKFARRALVESHSSVGVLQRPRLIVHGDASARACDLHAHLACSLASMQLVICC